MKRKIKVEETEGRFGCCPFCGSPGEYVNVYKDIFNLCEDCKAYWPIGWGLFSSWQEEDEKKWLENVSLLSSFRKVDPVWPDNSNWTVELPDEPQILKDSGHKVGISSYSCDRLKDYCKKQDTPQCQHEDDIPF